MKSFVTATIAAFLLAISSMSIADPPPQDLPGFTVTANPCSYGVTCIFGPGMGTFLMEIPAYLPPAYDSIPMEDNSLIATCKSMRDRARQMGCDVNNPPSAPRFPSPTQGQWYSNGCGDGSWKSEIGRYIAGYDVPGYTGDLTNPLPGVSFASACAYHDQCYYLFAKFPCDNGFGRKLNEICNTAGPCTVSCFTLRDRYVKAVENYGQHAYDSDHQDMECAKISKTLSDGDCMS